MATIADPEKKRLALEAGTYSVSDLAELLRCSEKNVRRKAAARQIPGAIRFGRLIRFSKSLIADWLRATR